MRYGTETAVTVPAEKYPLVSDRILRVNDVYTGTSFDSTVTVTTNGEDVLPNQTFTVYLRSRKKTPASVSGEMNSAKRIGYSSKYRISSLPSDRNTEVLYLGMTPCKIIPANGCVGTLGASEWV